VEQNAVFDRIRIMATIHRLDYAGAIHHVYGRGNDRQAIFLSDEDRAFFLGRLAKLKREARFRLYAFCLMTNHYHLLIETGDVPLAKIMDRLLGPYVARFNDKTGRVGHLFQRPYCAKLCARDSYFIRLVRYIHRNPVQAGMCGRAEEWPWSGHAQLVCGGGGLLDEELPLSFFGADPAAARREYAKFCTETTDDGAAQFIPDQPRVAPSIDLMDVAAQVAADHGVTLDHLLHGRRQRIVTDAKLELLKRAEDQGYLQEEVAKLLGCTSSALSHLRAAKLNNSRLPAG